MGILPYLNPDSKAAVALWHSAMMVAMVVVLTLVLALVALFVIEYLPARWRAFLGASKK